MNKAHFQTLLDMGYSALEALDLLNDQAAPAPEATPEPTPATPEPEPAPAPAPAPEPEESADPMDSIREEMRGFQEAVNKSIQELTRSIQRMNIRTMGTNENPEENRAEEFLAQLIKGGK